MAKRRVPPRPWRTGCARSHRRSARAPRCSSTGTPCTIGSTCCSDFETRAAPLMRAALPPPHPRKGRRLVASARSSYFTTTSVMQAINRSPVARSRAVYFARLNHVVAEGQRSLVKQRRAERASSGRTASWDDSRTVTFASVRNPFAWAVSQYEFGKHAHCKSVANSSRDVAHRYPVCAIADDAERTTPADATETTVAPPGHGAQNHAPPSLRQKQLRDHFAEWLREHDQLANSTKHEGFMAPNLIGLRSLKEKWCGREGDSGNAHHGTSQLRWLTTCDEEHWAVNVRSLACMFFLTDPAGKQAASCARS